MSKRTQLITAALACFTLILSCGKDTGTDPSATDKEITSFSFSTLQNQGLASEVSATISGDSVLLQVPVGTDVTALIATFESTGDTVKANGVVQVTGITTNNFTNPVVYTVISPAGSTATFIVIVIEEVDNAKAITAFSFDDTLNAALGVDVAATILGSGIDLTVPTGTNVTSLVATFTTTGDTVKVGTTVQQSGVTANNFASAVTYMVIGSNDSTQNFTVTVTVAPDTVPDSTKEFSAFSFESAVNSALNSNVTGTITGTNIALSVPFGTDVTGLIATFTTAGTNDTVKVGTAIQQSQITTNDFTNAVTYTVVAEDSSSQDYTVTVTVAAASSSKDITAYSMLASDNAALSVDVTGTISGTAIAATVPAGTNVTALVATFTTTGDSATVGGTRQVSGTTANDFSNPVTYVVTAQDGSTQNYSVTVTVQSVPTTITAFSFDAADNAALSSDVTATITDSLVDATVPLGTDVTALVATFTTAADSATVGGLLQTSGTTANDFTSAVTYAVHAGATSANYIMTVTVSTDTIDMFGTWSTAAAGTTLVFGIDSIGLQQAVDTATAYIHTYSNTDSNCVALWVVNPPSNKDYQKLGWDILNDSTAVLDWYDFKPNINGASGEATPLSSDTLSKQP